MPVKENKTVSLVLGSGGARGLAHIGVIHWLEQNGYLVKSVSGCSMGALIGGVYAAGKLDEFEGWVRAISKVDIVTLLDIAWRKSGLVKGDKVINTLKELVGDVVIEDLPVKYTAVAADIVGEKEVWMNSGPLFDAIRASISLPLLFTPFRYKDIDLIDGGVLNPVPIAPTFSDETDFTIAVNLGGKLVNTVKDVVGNDAIDKVDNGSISRIVSPFTEKVTEFIESFKDSAVDKVSAEWGAYDIANQAFDAMQSTIARQKLAAYPADYFIEIARNACGTLEFDRATEMIDLGYEKAQQSLGQLSR
ncbi:MAG: serine protease [Gammaproteobacteria bacterium]|nr:serine protease [Gammaproteobacteria bacterium]